MRIGRERTGGAANLRPTTNRTHTTHTKPPFTPQTVTHPLVVALPDAVDDLVDGLPSGLCVLGAGGQGMGSDGSGR